MHPLAAVAALVSFAAHGDKIEFQLDHGNAEIVWLTDRSFRFHRSLEGPVAAIVAPIHNPVPITVDDLPGAVRIRTKFLQVECDKHGLLLHIRRVDGIPLVNDVSEPALTGNSVTWERETAANARLYGLGPRPDPVLDIRGKSIDATIPFLISSAGYGEFYNGDGPRHFDITAAGRYKISAPILDYTFYYGPTPKEILINRKDGPPLHASIPKPVRPSWETLRDNLLSLVNQAMSGDFDSAFDLTAYVAAPIDLQTRARQIGSLVRHPNVGNLGLSPFRTQLNSFFEMYEVEIRDHAHPTIHALPFQFPDDPECARHADEFTLGDEMLIAPIYQPGTKRDVYLPQGVWTLLETNQEFNGKRTVSVDTAALPVFARNGTIVPLDSPGGMGLHYFPKLGAEFFLHEVDVDQYTQIHAAPAQDLMRLEIESKKDRDYQWVVHHVEKPQSVSFEALTYAPVDNLSALKDHTWFYDATGKNLHIRVKVKAGEDNIINIQ